MRPGLLDGGHGLRRFATITGAGVALAALGAWTWVGTRSPVSAQFQAVDLAAGEALYQENCASCHGAELEGQADWQSAGPDGRFPAPPHDETGHTWHHGDAMLFAYTKLGGEAALAEQGLEFDSGMPGFGDVLSDAEIRDILGYIRSTWPERIREVQADRSAAER